MDTPLLYLRGEHEGGSIDTYVESFRDAGVRNVTSGIITGSGHFAPEKNTEDVWAAIGEFTGS